MKINTKHLIIGGAAIVAIAYSLYAALDARNNQAYFDYLNGRFMALDKSLAITTKNKLDYDQTNKCYYWFRSDFNRGPLGCIIERAYYFPVGNRNDALIITKEILSSIDATFPFPRYQIPPFYIHQGIQEHSDKIGFDVGKPLHDSNASILNAYCSYQINYPNEFPHSGLPVRPKSNLVALHLFCGANASKAYYPEKDD